MLNSQVYDVISFSMITTRPPREPQREKTTIKYQLDLVSNLKNIIQTYPLVTEFLLRGPLLLILCISPTSSPTSYSA